MKTKKNTSAIALSIMLSLGSVNSFAAAPAPAAAEAPALTGENPMNEFNFAIGLGVHYLLGTPDVIEQTVDNGILRITSEEKYKLGLWLSTNTFSSDFCTTYCLDKEKRIKKGLFAAAQLGGSGNNGILNSFALGFSFMTNNTKAELKKNGVAPLVFQIGYGWTRIQTLADGYANGMTLPTGTNQPVMKKSISKGPVLLVSTAF